MKHLTKGVLRFGCRALLPLLLLTVPDGAVAQQDTAAIRAAVERQLGGSVGQGNILQQLQQAGISQSQARMQLMQMGYDPRMIDRYFEALGGGMQRGTGPDPEFVNALERIGAPTDTAGTDSIFRPAETDSVLAATADTTAVPVFGRSMFLRSTNQFEAVRTGPVGEDYELGAGDEVVIVLSGPIESAYTLWVTREGYITVPDLGQVFVNGLDLGELEARLRGRLGNVYSELAPDESNRVQLQVSLGRLRTNQVYVIGEVALPGTYQVSSLATVMEALYQAGGPERHGSFRTVEVRRRDRVVARLDLYEYLLAGETGSDVRLQQGDVVFIPLAGSQVRVEGAVGRPAIYEVTGGETLRDVLAFAGGPQPRALRRVQIDRILPPSQRRHGLNRVLVDVDLAALSEGEEVPVFDGDIVEVFGASGERAHRVVLTGGVERPGVYEWSPGATLWELIDRAEGLAEDAYTSRAHIYRLDRSQGSRRLIQAPLAADPSGRPARDLLLEDRDSVVIYTNRSLRVADSVAIGGMVKRPGNYPLAEDMTVEDLILLAGGFTHGALTEQVDVARLPDPRLRTDTTAQLFIVPLTDRSRSEGAATVAPDGGSEPLGDVAGENSRIPQWLPGNGGLELRHGDQVFVRQAPGYQAPRRVEVVGEVAYPGPYVLRTRQERISDLIQRAGGLTGEAYAPGIQLIRRGKIVALSGEQAIARPGGEADIALETGDSIRIPAINPTVLVRGAVNFESRVLFEPGRGLSYYYAQAGGLTEFAEAKRVSVTYPNGERATVRRALPLFRKDPSVEPGSVIYVPAVPESERGGLPVDVILTRTLTVMSTLATLLIALDRVSR